MKRADARYRWFLVGALSLTELVSWGVLYYAFAVLLVPMSKDLGLSTMEVTGAFSLSLLVYGATGLWVGRWLDRHSPRILMTAGSVAGGLLVVSWSQVRSPAALYLVFAGLGVAMATTLYEPAFVVVTKWFSDQRRKALTVLTLTAGLSSMVFSPLTDRLAAQLGWRGALIALAVILLAITVPVHATVLRAAAPSQSCPAARESMQNNRSGSLPGFRLLTASFVFAIIPVSAVGVHIVAMLVSAGQSRGFAAVAAGLVGMSQILGRALFGPISNRLNDSRLPTFVFGVSGASLVLLSITQRPVGVVVFAVVFGATSGIGTLLRASLIGDLYGQAVYGRLSGTASAFVLGARGAAPFLASFAALLPGGYTALMLLLAGVSAGAAVTGNAAVQRATTARSET